MVRGNLHVGSISPYSQCSVGTSVLPAPAAAAWPSANRAYFVPFRLPIAVTVYKMACGTGTGTTGNFDLGIYDSFGNRLVSTGSTAKTTASSERIVDVTDTFLLPGFYYLAMVTDGVTNYVQVVFNNLGKTKLAGIREMATAFALPATATLASATFNCVPAVAAYLRAD